MNKKRYIILLLGILLSWISGHGQLYINEFQASNINTVLGTGGNYLEWIEILNSSSSSVDLEGYYLTDDLAYPFYCEINGIYVNGHGKIVIWLEQDTWRLSEEFKLDPEGGVLALIDPDGEIVDSVTYPVQHLDISMGRMSGNPDRWVYYTDPTPGESNTTAAITNTVPSGEVSFSLKGGFYSGTQMLVLQKSGPEGTIRYTDDGSWPDAQSDAYPGPIYINETTPIRARLFVHGRLPGKAVTHTFIINDASTLPVVSITTDADNFFSDDNGIYVEGTNGSTGYCMDTPVNWNNDWERPVNFEYFSTEGEQEVNQLVGTKIYGGCSRKTDFKSLGIFARKKYGSNRMHYRFFESKDIDEFKTIVLRNSGNDSRYTLFRDGFMQSLLVGRMDIDYQAYQPAIVYINGEYWGIQNVREKINEHYPASNFGLDADSIDMLERMYYVGGGGIVHGSGEYYEEMIDYLNDHDISVQEHYETVCSMMDVNEFLNYYLAEIYFENEDWLHANIKYWRYHPEGGKWRWALYDTDHGWGLFPNSGNTLEWATLPNPASLVVNKLLKNDGFRDEFIQRTAAHINTTFSPQRVAPIFDSIKALVDVEIDRHIDRWGTPNHYYYNLHTQEVMPQFTNARPGIMMDQMEDHFDLPGTFTLTANIDDPAKGTIKLCEVSLPAGSTGLYFQGVPVRLEAIPRSGYSFSHWEGASNSTNSEIFLESSSDITISAVFEAATPVSNITLNEVCGSSNIYITDEYGEAEDWIEIYNDNDFDVDLGGYYLSDSAEFATKYRIPPGMGNRTVVKAKNFILIWCDGEERQGPLHANFKLSRSGETVSLVQQVGEELHLVDYIRYPEMEQGLTYGRIPQTGTWEILIPTPLADNVLTDKKEIFFNEYYTRNCGNFQDANGEADDWIEIYNPTPEILDVGGLFVTDSLQDPLKHQIPMGSAATRIPPFGHLVLWADNQPEQGPLHLGFKLDSESEQIGLYQTGFGYLDSLSYQHDMKGIVWGRFPDGTGPYQVVAGSPGSPNLLGDVDQLYINEFMASNRSTLKDEWDEFDDWIEVYNDNEFPVDIGGLYLTDSLGQTAGHRIPLCHADSTTIPAKGYLVLWADGQEQQGVLHLGFRLSGNGEEIGLIQPDGVGIIDSLSFGDAIPDLPLGRLGDGSGNIQYLSATPGSSNLVRTLEHLYINEFMANNGSTHQDGYGEYDDWIEIYNDNNSQVDIGGLFMTDSLGDPTNYRIPSSEPDSTTIPAKGYLVLWADGQEEQGVLHLGFRLNAEGEEIGLVQPDGSEFIDFLIYQTVFPNQALGVLDGDYSQIQIVSASPGYQNYLNPAEKIYISEIVASSNEMYQDKSGEYDDWIEIYNDNHFPVDIGGLFVTDSLKDPTRFRISAGNPDSTTIGPKTHLVLWADNQPEQGVNHLGFKLSGKGEQLALVSQDGDMFIDSVSFPDQYNHFSYSRLNSIGPWRFLRPTHGVRNICPPMPGITINEFMASSTTITDEYGEYDDWIELYNSNDIPVDVGGLYLTDSLGNPDKYRIPSHSPELTTIPANGYFVLYADDQSDQGLHHTNFRLGREGEQIGLIHYDEETVIDSLTYPSQYKNSASGRVNGEEEWYAIPPTPGEINILPDHTGLVINEVMGYNKTIVGDEYNEYEDWIELYNSSDQPVNIGGLFVSDSLADRTQFRISTESPDSTVIPPYGYLILWADGSDEQGILHLGLKVAKTGEKIALYGYDGALIDSTTYPFISPNNSWGRRIDGNPEWILFYHPTPLQPNLLTTISHVSSEEGAVRLYPNPVTDLATFELRLQEPGHIRIEIINSLGRVVSIVQHDHPGSGDLKIEWDASDAFGSRLEGGLYLYRISHGSAIYTGKFLVR